VLLVETRVFTRQVLAALPDEAYRTLQAALIERPDAGAVIRGSGGLRKLRWAAPGRGSRGGVRVIYYWAKARDTIVLLFLYPKNVQGDLSPEQVRVLRRIIEEEYP
jgi:mRNA-degrading endonuclease RelE of RelBE toxin-antitoxin system